METFFVKENIINLRLDKALTILVPNKSRVYLAKLIKDGNCLVNQKKVSPSYKVNLNDKIDIDFIPINDHENLLPYDLKLDIIYEDEDILVINKPQGLVVHPGGGHFNDTLVNALIATNKTYSTVNGYIRLGIVHRIDKDTSGLLLICKNDEAHNFIANQLKDHTMHREYIALCKGIYTHNIGKINAPIGRDKDNRLKMKVDLINGKEAITHFKLIKRFKSYSLVEFKLETGRTHQIRVHTEYINHPIIGDPIYGKDNKSLYNKGQLLHAYKLSLIHPRSKKEVTFTCDLPDYFKEIIENLD